MSENTVTTSTDVRVAIVGVGNCASSLVQGVQYYAGADENSNVPGLMHVKFGPYHVRDVKFVAGHSLGEYAALIAAGAVSFDDGVRLVRERGRLMQEACDREPSTMAAILGVEPDALRAICAQHGAHVCNINAPGNITIGGTASAVEAASAAATEAGASRVVPLTVSGAFHTPLMQTAADGMRQVLAGVAFSAPVMPVVSNVTAQPITEGSVLAEELASQITSPVLWADSVATMAAAGVTEVIEFGPGKVLTGLVKRIDRSIACRNVGTAEEASA